MADDDLEAAFQVFFVRGGRVLGRKGWVVDRVEELSREELVASFVRQLYMEREEVPPRVLVPAEPADRDVLEAWLGDRRGTKVRIGVPERGAKRRLHEVVTRNAAEVVPSAQAPARLRLRRPLARARGARRPPRPRAGAAAHRVLRHLQPRAHRHGRFDGRVRGRAAEALGLPAVPDQGRRRTGRFRLHGGDAPPPVHAAARGAGREPGRGPPLLATRPRSSSSTVAGGSSAWPPRCSASSGLSDPARRAREAARGGLLPRPSRPAADPARLRGAVRPAAPARRGAPVRGHLPPAEAREARPRLAARRDPRRRAGAQEGPDEAVRVARPAPPAPSPSRSPRRPGIGPELAAAIFERLHEREPAARRAGDRPGPVSDGRVSA